MFNALLKTFIRFRHCDEGVTLVEYGVAVALAVSVGVGALTLLGGDITDCDGCCWRRHARLTSARPPGRRNPSRRLLPQLFKLFLPCVRRLKTNGVCHGNSISSGCPAWHRGCRRLGLWGKDHDRGRCTCCRSRWPQRLGQSGDRNP